MDLRGSSEGIQHRWQGYTKPRNRPGSTNVETTPFQVYVTRQGVCQDFANVFITLARLLGIPARYVCGYIFTGNTGENRARSDASSWGRTAAARCSISAIWAVCRSA